MRLENRPAAVTAPAAPPAPPLPRHIGRAAVAEPPLLPASPSLATPRSHAGSAEASSGMVLSVDHRAIAHQVIAVEARHHVDALLLRLGPAAGAGDAGQADPLARSQVLLPSTPAHADHCPPRRDIGDGMVPVSAALVDPYLPRSADVVPVCDRRTHASYVSGCRCIACRRANALYQRSYVRRGAEPPSLFDVVEPTRPASPTPPSP